MVIESNVRPENPLGSAIFKIDSKWVIKHHGSVPTNLHGDAHSGLSQSCKMSIKIFVECTKKIWGVTNMVESILEKQAHASHQQWFELASEKIQEHIMEIQQSKQQLFEETKFKEETRKKNFKPEYVRLRLSTLKRVVSGTEKLAKMLSTRTSEISPPPTPPLTPIPNLYDNERQSMDELSDTPSERTSAESSEELHCVPMLNAVIVQSDTDTDHEHADLDLRKGNWRGNHRNRRWKEKLLSVIGVLLVICLVVWYFGSNSDQQPEHVG